MALLLKHQIVYTISRALVPLARGCCRCCCGSRLPTGLATLSPGTLRNVRQNVWRRANLCSANGSGLSASTIGDVEPEYNRVCLRPLYEKELIDSSVDRKNILNNSFAIAELQGNWVSVACCLRANTGIRRNRLLISMKLVCVQFVDICQNSKPSCARVAIDLENDALDL